MSKRVPPRLFQDDSVRLDLDKAVTVETFLKRRQKLNFSQCLALVNEAILVLEGLYVHLPVKRAMYAVDPVRRLRLLKIRLIRYNELRRRRPRGEKVSEAPPTDDLWFHREMTDTLTSVRDLHTMYVLPKPFDKAVALVPFQIEGYFQGRDRKYMVSNVIDGLNWFTAPRDFKRGVEVTHWNDVPMRRAVELAGARNAGSNPDARLARGLARLTIRPLAKALPPDEEWVTIHYKTEPDKPPRSLRARWHVVVLKAADKLPPDGAAILDRPEGLDYESNVIRILNKTLYSPLYPKSFNWSMRHNKQPSSLPTKAIKDVRIVPVLKTLRDVVQAKTFRFSRKLYGYIRLRTFSLEDPELFLEEFPKILESLPENGLIIDIRDNPGGNIQVGERLLQYLTPAEIQPETAQFINTPVSLTICEALDAYREWRESIRRAAETGTTFSSAYPLTTVDACNEVGQRYYGPVTLITNGLSYSTADIFAAGFQDHEIGVVLGVEGSTGAGGASVVTHSALRQSFLAVKKAAKKAGQPAPAWPLNELPAGDLRIAIRRTLRVGKQAGTELEDLGVIPNIRYKMTRDDLLYGNVDLIRTAVKKMEDKPFYRLREEADSVKISGKTVTAKIKTHNLARLDIAVDGWRSPSRRVKDDTHEIQASLPPNGVGNVLELRGFDRKSALKAVRKVRLS